MGLPNDWQRVRDWLNFSGNTQEVAEPVVIEKKLKHDYLPKLESYEVIEQKFWDKFPHTDLPKKPEGRVNIATLREEVEEKKGKMRNAEILRAERVIENLENGAPSYQMKCLPQVVCKNTPLSLENGRQLTDTLADWVVKKIAAGPFTTPLCKKFRVNPLMIVDNKGKKRPVLNVSAPKGASFNENIDKYKLEKIFMSSAKRFGRSVLRAGKGAVMTKFDMQDAYKCLPCKIEDLRLQGFQWGTRYFVETAQIFGARSSVANYDMLSNTILSLTMTKCSIPRFLVHRQLDDVPVVAPLKTNWCQEFTSEYANLCNTLEVKLADDCPKMDKAFKNSTRGKVLGIEFDTSMLAWRLPEDKQTEYMNTIHRILNEDDLSLKEGQELLGKLNFVCSMAPFMKPFLRPLQLHMIMLEEAKMSSCQMTEELEKDLKTWWAFLEDNKGWMNIPEEIGEPPLWHKTFTTDAAGWQSGDGPSQVGMGGVGFDEEGILIYAKQTLWNTEKASVFMDSKGKFLGHKTTTLELTGLLIPMLVCPNMFRNQHVVMQVDNMACHFAWQNGYVKGDNMATILIRAMKCVAAKLESIIHVNHHPRESSWESRLADRLSRQKTTKDHERRILESFSLPDIPEVFVAWLDNPREDWKLPMRLLEIL